MQKIVLLRKMVKSTKMLTIIAAIDESGSERRIQSRRRSLINNES